MAGRGVWEETFDTEPLHFFKGNKEMGNPSTPQKTKSTLNRTRS